MAEPQLPAGAEPAPHVELDAGVRVGAGSRSVLDVLVTNTAREPRLYAVLAVGVDSDWLPAPQRTPVLMPGESTVVPLEITPKAGTLPARYPLVVTVQALVPGSVPGAERAAPASLGLGDSAVIVNPRAQVTIEAGPARSTMVRGAKLRVRLTNGGATAATIELDDTTSKGLELRLRRRTVEVPAGGEVRLPARLVATRPRRVGAVVDHSWSITATTPEAVRQVRGVAQQRPLLGAGMMRGVALLLVVAIWVTGAIVGIPKLAEKFGKDDGQLTAETVNPDGEDAGEGADDGGATDPDGSDAGGGSDSAGSGAAGVMLNGTIKADDPSGFRVEVVRVPLDAGDSAAGNVAVPDSVEVALAASGKVPQSMVLTQVPDAVARLPRPITGDDGSWAIPRVPKPGYYLLSITKAGYGTQRFMIDSRAESAAEPLETEMVPGDGSLRGRVTGPGGSGVAGALVTVSDGTNTLTTSTESRVEGRGGWQLDGLDAPGTYVVQVSAPRLGSAAERVQLGPDGSSRVDVQLERGLVSLTGVVHGRILDAVVGLPGVTVTVEDGEGISRTTSTITAADGDANQATGNFILDGIPTPGSYTVTLSAPGFQIQTRKLELAAGETPEPLDRTLVRATGAVDGTIKLTGEDAGNDVSGAGLVLANDDFTYKTQVASRGGDFLLTGVVPGVYRLTTSLFGYTSNVQTVTVAAGRTTTAVKLSLAVLAGDGVELTSTITGDVVEANIGDSITCAGQDSATPPDCVTVTVSGEEIAPVGPNATAIARDGRFTLPTTTGVGLAPGLYQVAVSAPGYETATVDVRLGVDDQRVLPSIEMFPQPQITGRITTGIGTPAAPTCVWGVSSSAKIKLADLDAAACTEALKPTSETHASCPPSSAFVAHPAKDDVVKPYKDVLGVVCTTVAEGASDYVLQVPRRGDYRLVVVPTDTEYVPDSSTRVTAPVGGSVSANVELSRLARATFELQEAGPSGALQPAEGATIYLTGPDPATTQVLQDSHATTTATGTAEFTRLQPGTYTITALHGDNGIGKTTSKQLVVGYNQDVVRILPLVDEVDQIISRVTSNVDGLATGLEGATVRITAPASYSGTTPISATVEMTTDAAGCVAVVAPETTLAVPAAGGCAATIADVKVKSFVSRLATGVTVSAAGYETLNLSNRQLGGNSEVNAFALEPTPRPFTGTVEVHPDDDDDDFDYSTVSFRVESTTANVSSISVRSSSTGKLTWIDSRYTANDLVRPGSYTITPVLTGYTGTPQDFTCEISTSCALSAPMKLDKYGSLTVTTNSSYVVNGATTGVNATVALYRGGDLVATSTAPGNGNQVTFDNLVPGATNYSLRLRAVGFSTVDGPNDPDRALSCKPDGAAVPSADVSIEPGLPTVCVATMNRLPSITGLVSGKQGATTSFLSGAAVTATFCGEAGATCASPPSISRVTATDAVGRYTLGSSDTFEGFTEGQWQISVAQPGFTPVTTDPFLIVEGGADKTVDVSLDVKNVRLTVQVRDTAGKAVTDAVVTLSLGGNTIAQVLNPAVPSVPDGFAGAYVFGSVVPDFYQLTVASKVTGAGATMITSTYPSVEVRVGSDDQLFPAVISRGSNAVQGVVTGDGLALAGATVSVIGCPAGVCAVVTGTNGEPLTVTPTPATGAFAFNAVPDGIYSLRATRPGFEDTTGPPITFDHNVPQNPQTIELTSVKRAVKVVVDNPDQPADLLDGAKVTITASGSNPAPAPNTAQATQTMDGASPTFAAVRFGCWNVSVVLPAPHYGSITYPAVTDAPAPLGCSGAFAVGAVANDTPLVVTVHVHETPLTLSVDQDVVPGHAGPTSATVTVTGPTGTTPYVVDLLVTAAASRASLPASATIWAAPQGTYDLRAAALPAGGFSPIFWPDATSTVTGGTAASATVLHLAERTSKVTVLMENLTGVTGPATVRIVPVSPNGAVAPGSYPTGVSFESGQSDEIDLASGAWTVTATPSSAGVAVVTVNLVVDALTHTVTLSPKPGDDPGPD